jgi:T5SS/PEP-CTERM-associated repeat protein
MNVGQLGHGEFAVSDGGQIDTSGTTILPALVMAFDETATGIGYVYDGGTLNTTGQFVIGGGGTAEFYVQDGGSVTANAIGTAAAVFIGNGAASNGTATMNGGTWDVNGDFFIGGEGIGLVTVHDGATLDISQANSLLTLGFQDGGLGEMFVLGGQLLRPDTSTAITVGIGGRGRFEVREGSDVLDSGGAPEYALLEFSEYNLFLRRVGNGCLCVVVPAHVNVLALRLASKWVARYFEPIAHRNTFIS